MDELKAVANYIRTGEYPAQQKRKAIKRPELVARMEALKAKGPKRADQVLPETIKVDELDDLTRDALEAFGVNAAGALNEYACAAEDALIEAYEMVTDLSKENRELLLQYRALQEAVRVDVEGLCD